MPGLTLIRPADAAETVVAWQVALERRHGPTALVLSRQGLPVLDRTAMAPADGLRRGGYVLADPAVSPELILIATGSEVQIALEAAAMLNADQVPARVVSLPCWGLFDEQDAAYRESVLPAAVKARVAVEAGSTFGWERYVGDAGATVGIDHFGASAPAETLYEQFGLTAAAVVAKARTVLGR
jgi:transketolase